VVTSSLAHHWHRKCDRGVEEEGREGRGTRVRDIMKLAAPRMRLEMTSVKKLKVVTGHTARLTCPRVEGAGYLFAREIHYFKGCEEGWISWHLCPSEWGGVALPVLSKEKQLPVLSSNQPAPRSSGPRAEWGHQQHLLCSFSFWWDWDLNSELWGLGRKALLQFLYVHVCLCAFVCVPACVHVYACVPVCSYVCSYMCV
jgi:hypothetical protein